MGNLLLLDWSLVGISIGLFIGLVLALTGAGGSILAIPLLMMGFNLSFNQAAPIALLAVMMASIVGTIQGLRLRLVRYKTALLIASFGILFAPLGVWIAGYAPSQVLRFVFAVVLLALAWHVWRQTIIVKPNNQDFEDAPCMQNKVTSQLYWTAICTRRLIATGAITGFISGLLGVGGGFLIVPSLQKVSNFSMQTIVATSLMTVVLISIASIVSYSVTAPLQWNIAIPFALSTILGLLIFSHFSHKL
ncbi:MAG: sulfite exporter TauE/SafE family protein, partial [Pseudomonadota bacterium]